jgi:hypothetical protein
MKLTNAQKKENFKKSLDQFFEKNYLDIQGVTGSGTLDEAYLARILTKLAVSSATVWWSLLEIKQFLILRKNVRGR